MSNVSQMKGWVIHNEGGGSSKRFCRCGTPCRGVPSGGLMKTFHRVGVLPIIKFLNCCLDLSNLAEIPESKSLD